MAWRYYRTDPFMAAPAGHVIRASGDRVERLDDRLGIWDALSSLADTVADPEWERIHRIPAAVARRQVRHVQRVGRTRPTADSPSSTDSSRGLPAGTHQSHPDRNSTNHTIHIERGHASQAVSVDPRRAHDRQPES